MAEFEAKNLSLLEDKDKKAYIGEFWTMLNPIIDKRIMRRAGRKTKYKVEDGVSPDKLGLRKVYVVENGKKKLKFFIQLTPWRWSNGSIIVEVGYLESKNLVLPKRKIEKLAPRPKIWKPGVSPIWLIETMEPIGNYMKVVELSAVDVGLFSNMEMAFKNLMKK